MALSLVTAPSSEPITTSVAKLQLRVGYSADDELIAMICAASREYVETGTGRKCLPQTWDLKLDRFPCGPIELPFPPVSSIVSITYVDTAGVTQTWSSALYQTDLPAGPHAAPARIQPAYAQSYPQTRDQMNAVTVRFVCGYDEVPGGMLQAMQLLNGHWYLNRESVVVGTIAQPVQQATDALIWQYKVAA